MATVTPHTGDRVSWKQPGECTSASEATGVVVPGQCTEGKTRISPDGGTRANSWFQCVPTKDLKVLEKGTLGCPSVKPQPGAHGAGYISANPLCPKSPSGYVTVTGQDNKCGTSGTTHVVSEETGEGFCARTDEVSMAKK